MTHLVFDIEGPGYWKNTVHGIDYSHLQDVELKQALAIKTNVPPEDLLAPGKPIVALDLATAQKDDP